MAGNLEITLRADTLSQRPYWQATATEDDSPMWDGTGPTPEMALYELGQNLFAELMAERERNRNG